MTPFGQLPPSCFSSFPRVFSSRTAAPPTENPFSLVGHFLGGSGSDASMGTKRGSVRAEGPGITLPGVAYPSPEGSLA